jgi:hypothetical protein
LQEDDFRKPRLVILSPPREEEYNNIFISDIKLDRLAVAVGKKISIRIAINHIGKHIPAGMRVRFIVDSRVLSEKALELEPGGVREVSFEHVFGKKGSHVISAEIIGAHDSFADDDIRRLAVEAKEGIPVLLVQKNPPEDSSEGLTFLDLALNPGAGNASFFNTRRIGLKEFSEEKLERYGVVVLGDVPALLPSSVVALEKFISGGGGVMISLGDQTDPEIVNRFWYRDGDGFFPVSLEAVHSKNQGFQPAIIESSHPGLTVFSPHGRDVWRGGMVTRYFSFSDAGSSSGEIRNLVELDNGAPLIVERSLQQGRVILVASSLDLSWGKLPTKTAYVPLVRGLVEYLEGRVFPIRNLAPGESLVYGSVVSKPSATDPDGNNLPMETGIWQGRRVYLSDPISKAGIYSVTDSATGDEILYSVSLDPAESAFAGLSQETRNRIFNRVGAIGISQAEKIFRVFSPKSRKPAELWRWFLLAALGLLFFESYITLTQQRQSEMVEDRGNLSGGDL